MNIIWKLKTENSLASKLILGFSIAFTMFWIEWLTENDLVEMIFGAILSKNVSLVWLRNLFHHILNWLEYSVFFIAIYNLIWFVYSIVWRKFIHREICLQGDWLTIHDKETAKIGVAEIRQRYFNIAVDAVNVKPNSSDTATTTWNYIGSKFYPDEHSDIRLIGTYFAQRTDSPSKQGIHVFRRFDQDKKGNTIKMTGFFGDVLKLEPGRALEEYDKTGDILMFRMPPAIKSYIEYTSAGKPFNGEKLRRIVKEEQFQNEDFIKELREILARNKVKQKRREMYEIIRRGDESGSYGEDLITQIDLAILCVLKSMAQNGDGNINEQELETINKITGYNWTMRDLRNCIKVKTKDDVKNKILKLLNDIMDKTSNENHPVLFAELVRHICDAVAESDGTVVRSESEYKREIQSWINDFIQNL